MTSVVKAPDSTAGKAIKVGTVVRDRVWGGRYTGTVVRRSRGSIFVAWHGTWVEDELGVDEVEIVPDAEVTDEARAWRGGVMVADADGYKVVATPGRR